MNRKTKSLIKSFVLLLIVLCLYFFTRGKITAPTDNEETNDTTATTTVEYQKVARVIDGDTIELANGERVRYIGIDTPETVHPEKSVQCFGKQASAENTKLVAGKTVRLEKDVTDKDKYGRLLRYVYVDDVFVNLELVKRGYAFSYSYPPDVKFQNDFLSAEQNARENKIGLWAACSTTEGAHGRMME